MKLLPALLVSAAMCVATAAHAVVQTNMTPAGIGIRPGANSAYFFVTETLSLSCVANVIWINLTDSAGLGKTAYATVLSAKVLGKKLTWLEYTQDVYGNCYLAQVEIAP